MYVYGQDTWVHACFCGLYLSNQMDDRFHLFLRFFRRQRTIKHHVIAIQKNSEGKNCSNKTVPLWYIAAPMLKGWYERPLVKEEDISETKSQQPHTYFNNKMLSSDIIFPILVSHIYEIGQKGNCGAQVPTTPWLHRLKLQNQ